MVCSNNFTDEVPEGVEKADKARGFIKITSLKAGNRATIAAECFKY